MTKQVQPNQMDSSIYVRQNLPTRPQWICGTYEDQPRSLQTVVHIHGGRLQALVEQQSTNGKISRNAIRASKYTFSTMYMFELKLDRNITVCMYSVNYDYMNFYQRYYC